MLTAFVILPVIPWDKRYYSHLTAMGEKEKEITCLTLCHELLVEFSWGAGTLQCWVQSSSSTVKHCKSQVEKLISCHNWYFSDQQDLDPSLLRLASWYLPWFVRSREIPLSQQRRSVQTRRGDEVFLLVWSLNCTVHHRNPSHDSQNGLLFDSI